MAEGYTRHTGCLKEVFAAVNSLTRVHVIGLGVCVRYEVDCKRLFVPYALRNLLVITRTHCTTIVHDCRAVQPGGPDPGVQPLLNCMHLPLGKGRMGRPSMCVQLNGLQGSVHCARYDGVCVRACVRACVRGYGVWHVCVRVWRGPNARCMLVLLATRCPRSCDGGARTTVQSLLPTITLDTAGGAALLRVACHDYHD